MDEPIGTSLAAFRPSYAQLVLVSEFAENKDIPTNPDNIMRFLDSLHGPLVNEVPTKVKPPRPASFALPASPTGKKKMPHTVGKPKGWNKFLLEVCELMQNRHSEGFRQIIISVPGWFSELEDSKFSIPVGNEGIYTRWENSAVKIRETCYDMVTEFGYPRDSLEIKDSKGAIL